MKSVYLYGLCSEMATVTDGKFSVAPWKVLGALEILQKLGYAEVKTEFNKEDEIEEVTEIHIKNIEIVN